MTTSPSVFTDHQRITLPSSKSMIARKLCIDFIGGRRAWGYWGCDDVRNLSRALETMSSRDNCMVNAGDSATALRFLTAIAAARHGTITVIDGTEQLQRRPVGPLVDALRSMGAYIVYLGKEGYAPLLIHGRQLQGGTVDFTGTGSSQYASACVLISPLTTEGIAVVKHDRASLPYLKMTQAMMLRPRTRIEADWSAASYLYEWTVLTGQPLLLRGLRDINFSLQGDARAMKLYRELWGVRTVHYSDGLLIYLMDRQPVPDDDVVIDMAECPDLVPALGMTLALTGRRATLTGLGTLRIKESDRLTTLSEAIARLGGHVKTRRRGGDYQMQILGKPEVYKGKRSVEIHSYGDHRIAMCALAAAGSPLMRKVDISVTQPECVAKSFPEFTSYIDKLRKSLRDN